MGANGVADPVVDERLLPAAVDLHQTPPQLGGQPSAQRLIQRVLLVAEPPADIGLEHPDLPPGHPQRLPADAPHDMGDLRGGGDSDPVPLHMGGADVVFDVAVLDGGRVIPSLHLEESRLPGGGFVVPGTNLRMGQDVPREILVDLRRVRLHRLLHVQHKRQLLIADPHQSRRPGGGHVVLRHHHGHVVPVVAHMPAQQEPVADILVAGVCGPGVSGGGKAVLRNVKTGEDPHHPRHLLRLRRVHRGDQTVGHRRVDQPGGQSPPVAQVLRILRPACRLVKGVHPGLALSYVLAHRYPSFSSSDLF